jgi:alpha-L-rhamnosidase
MSILPALVFLFSFVEPAAPGAPNPTTPLERASWRASWITAKDAPERDETVIHLRKVIDLATVPGTVPVNVSGDPRYVLHVNGQRVGAGPSRGDIEHWRYRTYDLAPLLKTGKNIVAATIWTFGLKGPMAQITRRTGFIMQGVTPEASAFDTNKTWEAQVDPGHSSNLEGKRPIIERHFFYAAGPAERRDANRWNWDWDSLRTSVQHPWFPAVSIGRGTPRGLRDGHPHEMTPDGWLLMADPLPPMQEGPAPVGTVVRQSGRVALEPGFPVAGRMTVAAKESATVLLDRKEIVNAYPRIRVSHGRGARVRVHYGESLFAADGTKGNRNEIEGKTLDGLYDEFVLDGQSRTLETLWWRSWRYLQIEVVAAGEGVVIDEVAALSTAFPLEQKADFSANDPQLKTLWDMAFRTLRISAWETYMDSPYWEQLQYVGDTRITALLSYAMSNEDRLAKQAIVAFDNSRTADGLTMSRYPTRDAQYIPPYSLFWVGMVHDFWMYRNDPEFVRARLPGIRAVLQHFLVRQRADGLLGYIHWWSHVDPAAGNARQTDAGGSAAVTLQFVAALREAAELERALGEPLIATAYQKAATRASSAVAKLFDSQRGLLRDNPESKDFSHDVNILALWQGVLSGKQREALADGVFQLGQQTPGGKRPKGEIAPASIYFRYYLHVALARVGRGDTFLSLIEPWRKMLGLGLTTFPEFSDPTRTDSHAWTAHPALGMLAITLGIEPTAPGFAKVRIAPSPGKLTNIQGRMPHPSGGHIVVSIEEKAGKRIARIELPPGVPGEFIWKRKRTALAPGSIRELPLSN